MAVLSSLPFELLDAITYYLGADDLLSLRLTSAELNNKLRDTHLIAIYRCRRISIVPASLENLVKISKHPSGVNKLVQVLKVIYCSPYLDYRLVSTIVEDRDPEARAIRDGMCRESEKGDLEVKRMKKWGDDIGLLTVAFQNLPNLRTIECNWQHSYDFSREEFNLFFPSLRVPWGGKLHPSLDSMAILTTSLFDSGSGHHWTTVITAAILTGSTRIQAIRDKRTRLGTGIPIEWFVLPNSQVLASEAVFSNLKILEITIDAAIITYQSHESLNKALYSWLGAIGTKVEHLELRFRDTGYRRNPWASRYWIERIKLPAKKIFPKLKHLSLENLDLSLDTLTSFLMNTADTLEWLELHICDLENEKEDWLSFLKFSKGKLKTLRHLAMYISRPNEQAEEFLLPDIVVVDGWDSPRTPCYVKTPKNPFESSTGDISILADRRGFETVKILDEELEINKDADSFWESMTDGFWKNDRVVNWGGFRSMQLSL